MFRRRLAALVLASFATAETHADFNYEAQRRAMVREIENEVAETNAYTGIDARCYSGGLRSIYARLNRSYHRIDTLGSSLFSKA